MLKRIHVNQHAIRRNAKLLQSNALDRLEPCITVKTYKENRYCNEVEILGPSRIVYQPEKPLACGAKVWIETKSEVNLK